MQEDKEGGQLRTLQGWPAEQNVSSSDGPVGPGGRDDGGTLTASTMAAALAGDGSLRRVEEAGG